MRFSKAYLRDCIYACWIGKNIGGTIGTPFEGRRELLDVKGFVTEPGKPLANDDLDLQLVWLRAVDELGPEQINSKTLGEYWLAHVKPHWNEYGVGKGNMRGGFFPPLSGELFNEHWTHSNGAWIRTEIWASLYPGQVDKAIRFAFEDASVDHGFGEGSYAAIFVAAMESAAFVIKDLRVLIDIGLSKIPEDCRIAKAVRLVCEEYDKGTDWRVLREMLIEQSADIGWFQAPANVGFTVLGLLYGEGDFKKSVLIAVSCGDDTVCTGATAGALMGILNGMEGIPADWRAFIGDDIVNGCLLFGHGRFPKSCTELTDNVMNLLPVTCRTGMQQLGVTGEKITFGDENDFADFDIEAQKGRAFVNSLARRGRWSFSVESVFADAFICFEREPVLQAGETLRGKVIIVPHTLPEARQWRLRWVLPEGWHVSGRKSLFTASIHDYDPEHPANRRDSEAEFTITAGEDVEAVNHLLLDISAPDRPTHIIAPITILG